MADYPLVPGVNDPINLGIFYEEVLGPAPEIIPPDPYADELPPALYYIGGRAGVWVPPILCGNSLTMTAGMGIGLSPGVVSPIAIGSVVRFLSSAYAPLVEFINPAGATDNVNMLNLGQYSPGTPFKISNKFASQADQHWYQFTLSEPCRLKLKCSLASGVDSIMLGWSIGFESEKFFVANSQYFNNSGNYYTQTTLESGYPAAEWESVDFPKGTHIIRAIPYGSDYGYPNWASGSTYRIEVQPEVSQAVCPDTTYPGYHLGAVVGGNTLSFSGQFAAGQTEHWYRAYVGSYSTNKSVSLSGMTANLDLAVYQSNVSKGSSANSGTTNESVSPVGALQPGNFDIKVINTSNSTSPYTLMIA